MRDMRDSGFGYLGEIPAHWNTERIKNHLRFSPDKNPGDATILSLYREHGIVPKDSRDDNHNVTSEDTSNYRYVRAGDFVVNKMKAWQGSMGVSAYEGVVSPAYYVYRFTTDVFDKKYLHYLLRSKCYADEFRRLSGGIRIGQWDLPKVGFETTYVAVPPKDEQTAIAVAIDVQLNKVDTLIANVQAQIEKLKAFKQSVITEVVTKGLDPSAPMKDSGVEWVSQIPASWEMSRVGLHYTIILGKMLCPSQIDESYTLEKYYCAANVHFGEISSDELKEMWFSPVEKEQYRISVGDMLIVEGGAGAGGCAIVQQHTDALIQNSVMIVRNRCGTDNRYLRYWIESMVKRGYLDVACNKATIPHYTKEKLAKTIIPVLTQEEQAQIADYLDEKCDQIGRLIAIKQTKIERMEQYKRSLIYEYVTGKREVV